MNLNSRNYYIGIGWFILSLLISFANDCATKYLSENCPTMQIAFFRFFFGCISLLPFMCYYRKQAFKTSRWLMHACRGIILFVGISVWIIGLNIVPIAVATLTTFVIPLFILIMAPLFLNEKISISLVIATICGFIGVLIILEPHKADFNWYSLIMLLSAFLFAALDIINKKFVAQESMLSMLFYSTLVTTILAIFPALKVWQEITDFDLVICIYLGCASNVILFCLLKAFNLVNASSVAPYRYLELIISIICGVIFFHEYPTFYTLFGAFIIIPSTMYIAYKKNDAI